MKWLCLRRFCGDACLDAVGEVSRFDEWAMNIYELEEWKHWSDVMTDEERGSCGWVCRWTVGLLLGKMGLVTDGNTFLGCGVEYLIG